MGSINFKSVYESHYTNSQINASAKEAFFSGNNDKVAVQRYQQSFNFLEIVNDSSIRVNLYLDGKQVGRTRYLFGKNQVVILPEEELYFNMIELENSSSTTAINAGDIRVIGRIMKPIVHKNRVVV